MVFSKRNWISFGLMAALAMAGLSACNSSGGSQAAADAPTQPAPTENKGAPTPAAPAQPRHYTTDALIYGGDSAAFGGPEALEAIATSHGLTHKTVTSAELDAMSLDEIASYGVILWPGGYAGQMSNSLRASTRENIRRAVNERGVGFVGFCAGAFIAVSPPAKDGAEGPEWGFAIVPAETLPYYHLEDEGTDTAMIKANFADGSSRDLVWWGGPTTPEFPGGVVARYADDGKPAISQTWAGAGLMVIAGPHPEAPEDWRSKLNLDDSDGLDQEVAFQMIDAALHQKPMKAF